MNINLINMIMLFVIFCDFILVNKLLKWCEVLKWVKLIFIVGVFLILFKVWFCFIILVV